MNNIEKAVVGDNVEGFVSALVALRGVKDARQLLERAISFMDAEAVLNNNPIECLFKSIQDQPAQHFNNNESPHEIHNGQNDQQGIMVEPSGKDEKSKLTKSGYFSDNLEVLAIVFSYLDFPTLGKVAEVSSSWQNLALNPSFWSFFHPSPHFVVPVLSHANPDVWVLPRILRLPRFSRLHSIDITPWKEEIDDQWIVDNLTHLQKLKNLKAFDCHLVAFAHDDLTMLTSLTSLDVGSSVTGSLVSNQSLAIMNTLTNLQTINLHYCEKINDYGLKHIIALPKLKSLDLGDCYKITMDQGLAALHPLCSTLTYLSLKSNVRSNFYLTDERLSTLHNFSKLTYLDIGYCKRITEKGMPHVAQVRSLTYLGMSATSITDAGLVYLTTLTNLQKVDVANCYLLTTSAPRILTMISPVLRSLTLRGIPLGNHSVWNLSGLRECPNLEEIDFTNTYIDDQILDERYTKVGVALKTMNLSYCSGITDVGVRSVCIALPRLQRLILSRCHRLTDATLEYLTLANNLRFIDLSGTNRFTDQGLEKLRRVCPDLTIVL